METTDKTNTIKNISNAKINISHEKHICLTIRNNITYCTCEWFLPNVCFTMPLENTQMRKRSWKNPKLKGYSILECPLRSAPNSEHKAHVNGFSPL